MRGEAEMATISRDKVVENWNTIVKAAAGKDTWVIDTIERSLKDVNAPNVTIQRTQVSAGMFSTKRDFLEVTHGGLREYAMYMYARDFGRDLDVGWYLTLSPGFLKRTISKYSSGNPQALSMAI